MDLYQRLFGLRTGRHTHPATHPWWMDFADGECVVCDGQARRAADLALLDSAPATWAADHWRDHVPGQP